MSLIHTGLLIGLLGLIATRIAIQNSNVVHDRFTYGSLLAFSIISLIVSTVTIVLWFVANVI